MSLAALFMSVAQVHAAILDGTYSNVCMNSETGDLGGVELQIAHIGDRSTVSLKTCEGGCWQQPTRAIVMRGNQIVFSAADQGFDQSGKLVHTTVRRFTAIARGKGLVLESHTYSPGLQRLQKQPPGTSTGNPKEQPIPVHRCL